MILESKWSCLCFHRLGRYKKGKFYRLSKTLTTFTTFTCAREAKAARKPGVLVAPGFFFDVVGRQMSFLGCPMSFFGIFAHFGRQNITSAMKCDAQSHCGLCIGPTSSVSVAGNTFVPPR